MRPYIDIDWESEGPGFEGIEDLVACFMVAGKFSVIDSFRSDFEQFQQFSIPATTFSPMMLFTLYALAASQRPNRMVIVGIDAGISSAALLLGSSRGSASPSVVVGNERNPNLVQLALENFRKLNKPYPVEVTRAPAMKMLMGQPPESADLVLLDNWPEDHPRLIEPVLNCLSPRGVILIHDALWSRCQSDMTLVQEQFATKNEFETAMLPVDDLGLWVARRKSHEAH